MGRDPLMRKLLHAWRRGALEQFRVGRSKFLCMYLNSLAHHGVAGLQLGD